MQINIVCYINHSPIKQFLGNVGDKDKDTENDSDTPETLEIEETTEEELLDSSVDSSMFVSTY